MNILKNKHSKFGLRIKIFKHKFDTHNEKVLHVENNQRLLHALEHIEINKLDKYRNFNLVIITLLKFLLFTN